MGSEACVRAPEAFGFMMLKYAFSHILETLFLPFLASSSTPKSDKNRTFHCTLINLRYFYIITHFAKICIFVILHEKVIPLII